jgi:aminotransferase
MAGGTPVAVPVSAADGWRVTGKLLAQYVTPRTRLLVLNHPGNPTGVTLRKKELNSIAKLAIKHNLLVVSDEIYAELTYTGSHTALASLPGMLERTVTLAGFSKAWAMTGYRLGILAGPEPVVSAALKLHQYSALCASSLAQTAAIEALEHGDAELAKMRTEYALRRDYCVGECQRLGLPLVPPDGAFYLFPEVRSRTGLSGEEFALRLLHEKGVAVVPGNAFGAECADYIRLSFATSLDKLGTAWERIGELLKSLKK